jgi:hypothetical protein
MYIACMDCSWYLVIVCVSIYIACMDCKLAPDDGPCFHLHGNPRIPNGQNMFYHYWYIKGRCKLILVKILGDIHLYIIILTK